MQEDRTRKSKRQLTLLIKIKILLEELEFSPTTRRNESQLSFYHETIQERYLTCCCCLLLFAQECQPQQQLQTKEIYPTKMESLSTYSEDIKTVLNENPMLKHFIHDLVQVYKTDYQGYYMTRLSFPTKASLEVYQRMGIQLLSYFYSLPEEIIVDQSDKSEQSMNDYFYPDANETNYEPHSNDNDAREAIEEKEILVKKVAIKGGKSNQINSDSNILNLNEWKEHFQMIHELFVNRFRLITSTALNDEFFPMGSLDVEILQLLTLLLKNYTYYCLTETSVRYNKNTDVDGHVIEMKDWIEQIRMKFHELPQQIFEYYHYHYQWYQQQHENQSDTNAKFIPMMNNLNNDCNNSDDDTENIYKAMLDIITSILDNNRSKKNNEHHNQYKNDEKVGEIAENQEQFELVMIQYFNQYVQFVDITSNTLRSNDHSSTYQQEDNKPKITKSALLNMIEYITTQSTDSMLKSKKFTSPEQTTSFSATRFFLQLSILSVIHKDVSKKSSEIVKLLSSRTQNEQKQMQYRGKSSLIDVEIAISIQKLVLFNLSSVLDNTSLQRALNKNNKDKITVMRIRTMTLDFLSILIERCGIDWISSSTKANKSNNLTPKFDKSSSLLGGKRNICTIIRMVVGEFRLIMGQFIDMRYQKDDLMMTTKDDDYNTQIHTIILERIGHCIQIGVNVLHIMLDMANEVDNIDDVGKAASFISNFTPDAILHLKHSLEDMLDSTVQFLLHENILLDDYWQTVALQCCRYLGCYLSEVDIFDYDDGIDHLEEEEYEDSSNLQHISSNRCFPKLPMTKMSSHQLFLAVKSGLHVLYKHQDMIESEIGENLDNCLKFSKVSVITLFPCIFVILTNCISGSEQANNTKKKNQIKLTEKYLLNDRNDEGILVTLLCSVMDKTLESSRNSGMVTLDDETMLNVSWCNKIIESLFEFMIRSKSQIISSHMTPIRLSTEDDVRVQKVCDSMSHWFNCLSPHQLNDGLMLNEIATNILTTVMQNLELIKEYVNPHTQERIQKRLDKLSDIGIKFKSSE